METVKFKKLSPDAVIPERATDGSAGMDLFPVEVSKDGDMIKCRFGFAMSIPKGHAAFIFPRSSIKNFRFALTNSVGLIDSDYRGEVMAFFRHIPSLSGGSIPDWAMWYEEGMAVAQMVIMPVPDYLVMEVDELDTTERGSGGFGSTNK